MSDFRQAKKNDDGASLPLLLAVHGERAEEVERLLASGVDVNLSDADGLTPLMASAMNGSLAITRLLLDAGADPSRRNRWEMTALAIAVFHGHSALAALLDERLRATGRKNQ